MLRWGLRCGLPGVFAAAVLLLATVAIAAPSGVVTVSVTPATRLSITVNPTTCTYGILPLSLPGAPSTGFCHEPGGTNIVTVTNDGEVNAALSIYGSAATEAVSDGGNDQWTLAAVPGPDQYVHAAIINAGGLLQLTTIPASTGVTLVPSAGSTFTFQLTMPTAITTSGQMTTTITFVATQAP